jgi:hypothetical protein
MPQAVTIPELSKDTVVSVLSENSLFTDVDSNLAVWLEESIEPTPNVILRSHQLVQALDNKELVEFCGGELKLSSNTVTLSQIRSLVERQLTGEAILLTDGYSNLFFVQGKDGIYIVGVVIDKTTDKYVPYIYRRKNLYRAWNKGNRVFVAR